ncbi:MAG: C4-type zinc ribbon domain-containing protein [Dehalococcoidia bacterium]
MASLNGLFGLQETDLLLDKAQARLAEIEVSLTEPEELQAARDTLAERDGVLTDFRVQQKEAEQVADDVRAKAAEVEKKLYSGTVKNAKELQDLDADLRSLKGLVARREDEMMAILEQAEEADGEVRQARAELDELEGQWKVSQDEMLSEQKGLMPEAERLQASRTEQATTIERSVLSLYDNLRARKGGRAVARLERGMCGGCRITLPTSIMQRVRGASGIVQCVSCERLLLT